MSQNRLTAEAFRKSFLDAWRDEKAAWDGENPASDTADFRAVYRSSAAWTRLMLGDPSTSGEKSGKGVLRRALQALLKDLDRCSVHYEWLKLDLVAARRPLAEIPGEFSGADSWNTRLLAIVEHENADDVETEMWKLIHIRSELKVLVFYDFSDDDSARKQRYKADKTVGDCPEGTQWLGRKIDLLQRMVDEADRNGEPDPAQYLIIVGKWATTSASGKADGGGVCWNYYERFKPNEAFGTDKPLVS